MYVNLMHVVVMALFITRVTYVHVQCLYSGAHVETRSLATWCICASRCTSALDIEYHTVCQYYVRNTCTKVASLLLDDKH